MQNKKREEKDKLLTGYYAVPYYTEPDYTRTLARAYSVRQ